MKNVKFAIMAVAALTGVAGAFAFSPKTSKTATTYYAVQSGSSFIWTTNDPSTPSVSCKDTLISAICTIVTDNQPSPGVVPAGHTSTRQLYK